MSVTQAQPAVILQGVMSAYAPSHGVNQLMTSTVDVRLSLRFYPLTFLTANNTCISWFM